MTYRASPIRDCVVVVFGSEAPAWCKLSHCPMHAHGPYTQAEAQDAVERMPVWMQPHILTIQPEDSCLGVRP